MTPERLHRLRSVLDRRQPDLTVLLEDVHKPHNLSAILRTCDAVGVFSAHAVATRAYTAQALESIAMGSGRWVELVRHRDLDTASASLRAQGMAIYAADPAPQAVDFREVDYTRPVAVLFGEEKAGLSAEARARADALLAVPMAGMVASLNVSVAAALVLFEAQRQRRAAGLYDAGPRLDPETYRRALFEWCYPYLADLCRRRGVPYPGLDEHGEVVGELPR